VSVARQQLRFVPGSPARPPAAARADPLKRRGPVRVAPAVAAAPPPAAPPVQRRRRWRRGLLLLLLAALAIPLVRGCDTRAPPPRQLGPGEKAPLSDKLAL